jgi:diguanylate cyclase (GGDEF)-like protein/PAS domain S-box-containing protein
MARKPTYEELERRVRELENSRSARESIRDPLLNLLRLVHEDRDLHGLIREVTELVRNWFGCSAAGIRLKEDEDFPYLYASGFPREHVESENRLCAVDERGERVRDPSGNPVLECMCGSVLCGRIDPGLPFFTEHGSFITNSTTEFLATPNCAEKARNRCHCEGYESVALVPLKKGAETFGLLQLNDRRRDFFTSDSIDLLEQIAANLSLALEQRRALQELRRREEELAAIYDKTPFITLLVDPDLRVRHANTAACRHSGFPLEAITGRPVGEVLRCQYHYRSPGDCGANPFCEQCPLFISVRRTIHDWEFKDRIEVVLPVSQRDKVSSATFLLSTALLRNRDDPVAQVTLEDITAHKRTEEILQARLRLMEHSLAHSYEEILTATLDEAEGLTESRIGFFCSLEADLKTLRLRAWSTRTVQEERTAEDLRTGARIRLEEAGVWADCIRRREPIVHNDSAYLDRKGGLPPGHPHIVRELIVPVYRGDTIVAILGVGNKPGDYTNADIEAVSLLANLAWDIAERKRAEEALRRSESYYRTVFETSGAATVIINTDYTISLANQRAAELTGYTCREMERGMRWPEFIHPEDVSRMMRYHRLRRREPEAAPWEYEFRLLDRRGRERHAFLNVDMIPGTGQSVASLIEITQRKRAEEELRSQRELLEVVIDGIEDVLAIKRPDHSLERLNRAGCELFGLAPEEAKGRRCFELFGGRRECRPCASRMALERRAPASVEGFFPDLERYLRCRISPVKDEQGNILRLVEQLQDISQQKRHEARLQSERDYMYKIFNSMVLYVLVCSQDLRIEFLNPAARELFGDCVGQKCYEQLQRTSPCSHCPAQVILRRESQAPIHFSLEAFGRILEGTMTELDSPDGSISLLTVMQDVTESRRAQEKVRYLSFHDSLTGLYNRAYLEEEMQRLSDERYCPMGIVVCDINGLKLINDTLGHHKGDELLRATAEILRKCFRSSDVAARIGGDEFAILLPRCDRDILSACRKRIRNEIEQYNDHSPGFGLSLSVGTAIQHRPPTDMNALFKRADDAMYKEKLQQSYSSRSATVQALIQTLQARDYLTEGHGSRLYSYAWELGRTLNLSEERLNDLHLLARFHDLGKVGVPDHILFKRDALTEEEFQEMKRHSEIGHRIARSLSDLAPIADLILKHHEWWDGNGYPLGLSGEDIPLECRILAIVDAYDTMIHQQPYKRAYTFSEAVRELRRWAGTQFDPDLVERFIGLVSE